MTFSACLGVVRGCMRVARASTADGLRPHPRGRAPIMSNKQVWRSRLAFLMEVHPGSRAAPRARRRAAVRPLPLVPLRTFHLVARLRSFSAAARQIGVTQPAVTQQIARLERDLGLALFDRVGGRVVVTDAGRTLDVFAQRIFHLLDAARLRTGRLHVGASRTAGAYYIADLLDRFKQRYPGVRVRLSVGNSNTILAQVLDFTLHAGVIAGPCENPHLRSLPLIRDRMLAILPPGHPLAHRPAVTMQELHAYPLILREPGSATRRMIERAFQRHGLEALPAMELESNEAIKSAVADGIGVGIMAQAAVAQELATGRLAGRPLREPLHLDFSLIYHRDRTLSPVVAAFLALLPAGGGRAPRAPDRPHQRVPRRSHGSRGVRPAPPGEGPRPGRGPGTGGEADAG